MRYFFERFFCCVCPGKNGGDSKYLSMGSKDNTGLELSTMQRPYSPPDKLELGTMQRPYSPPAAAGACAGAAGAAAEGNHYQRTVRFASELNEEIPPASPQGAGAVADPVFVAGAAPSGAPAKSAVAIAAVPTKPMVIITGEGPIPLSAFLVLYSGNFLLCTCCLTACHQARKLRASPPSKPF